MSTFRDRLNYLVSDLDRDQMLHLMEWLGGSGMSVALSNIVTYRQYHNLPPLNPWEAIPEPYSYY